MAGYPDGVDSEEPRPTAILPVYQHCRSVRQRPRQMVTLWGVHLVIAKSLVTCNDRRCGLSREVQMIVRAMAFVSLAFLGSAMASAASAQHVIAGVQVYCNDFRGIPVLLIANPNMSDVGMATLAPNGQPVMMLNPMILNRLPRELQLFWYGHECAHHVLGHIARRAISNEAEADCWAVVKGREEGWFPPRAFEGLIAMLGNSQGSPWGHLPGRQRIQNMLYCYENE